MILRYVAYIVAVFALLSLCDFVADKGRAHTAINLAFLAGVVFAVKFAAALQVKARS